MINFINLVKEVLEDKGMTTQNLFDDGVISENIFYKYKHRYPNLTTLLKIANYLCERWLFIWFKRWKQIQTIFAWTKEFI